MGRNACNDFIDHTCNSLAKDVFGLVGKLDSSTPESLQSASFFNASNVKEILGTTLQNLESKVKDVISQMGLYLDNTTTQNILLNPVSKKISKWTEEIRKAVNEMIDGN